MKTNICLLIIILCLFGCKKNNFVVNPQNNSAYDYSIDQVKLWVNPNSGTAVRIYSKADTIIDVRLISDNSQLTQSLWVNYRTIKGLNDELAKWDTSSFIVADSMDITHTYRKYVFVQAKLLAPGSASFTIRTSNYIQSN